MLMLLSSMTATSSDGTFGWPTPMATPTMTTIATSATPKKIARFRFDRTSLAHRGGSIAIRLSRR